MTRCKLCNHPEKAAIEQGIAARELTQAQAAKIVDCNPAAISRHMRVHVAARIKESMKPEPVEVDGLNVVNALLESRARILSVYDEARQTGDMRAAIQALQCEVSQLTLMGKLSGQFSDGAQIDILMNPELYNFEHMLVETFDPEERVKISERWLRMNEEN
jgi:hypothetical protein